MSEWLRVLVPGVPAGDPVELVRVAARLEALAGVLEQWEAAARDTGAEVVSTQEAVPVRLWWRAWNRELDAALAVAAWARQLAERAREYATVLSWVQTTLSSIRIVEGAIAVVSVVGAVAAIATCGASGALAGAAVAAAHAAVQRALLTARTRLAAVIAATARGVAVAALTRATLSVAQDAAWYRPLAQAADPTGVHSWYGWDHVARRAATAAGNPLDVAADALVGGLGAGLGTGATRRPTTDRPTVGDLVEQGYLYELTDLEAAQIVGAGRDPRRIAAPRVVTRFDEEHVPFVKIAVGTGYGPGHGMGVGTGFVIGTGPQHTTIVTNRHVLFENVVVDPFPWARDPRLLPAGTGYDFYLPETRTHPWSVPGAARPVTEIAFPLLGTSDFQVVSALDDHRRPLTVSVPSPADLPPNADVPRWREVHPWYDQPGVRNEARAAESLRDLSTDLGVLHLHQPAPPGTTVVDIPDYADVAQLVELGQPVHLTGYGHEYQRLNLDDLVLNDKGPGLSTSLNQLVDDVGYLYSVDLDGASAAEGFGRLGITAHGESGGSGALAWAYNDNGVLVPLGVQSRIPITNVSVAGELREIRTDLGHLQPGLPLARQQSFLEHALLPDDLPWRDGVLFTIQRSDATHLVHLNQPLREWLRWERDHPR